MCSVCPCVYRKLACVSNTHIPLKVNFIITAGILSLYSLSRSGQLSNFLFQQSECISRLVPAITVLLLY
jgi:hypothetical protein